MVTTVKHITQFMNKIWFGRRKILAVFILILRNESKCYKL